MTSRPERRRLSPRPSRLLALAASTLLALVAGAATAHAAPPEATVTIDVAESSRVGDTVTVVVRATDVVDLYAYDLTLGFDAELLRPVGTPSGPDGGHTSSRSGDGTLGLTHTRLGTSPGLEGDAVLGTVGFTALAPGETEISLDGLELVSSTDETSTPGDLPTASVTISAAAGDGDDGATDGDGATSPPPTTGAGSTGGDQEAGSVGLGGLLPDAGGPLLGLLLLALAAVALGVAVLRHRQEAAE